MLMQKTMHLAASALVALTVGIGCSDDGAGRDASDGSGGTGGGAVGGTGGSATGGQPTGGSGGSSTGGTTSSGGTGGDPSTEGTVSMQLDGETISWTPENSTVTQQSFAAFLITNDTTMEYLQVFWAGTEGTTGTFDCQGFGFMNYGPGVTTFSYGADEDGGLCSITVIAFGAVGEAVQGTFSGTLISHGPAEPDKVITNGTFDFVRAR